MLKIPDVVGWGDGCLGLRAVWSSAGQYSAGEYWGMLRNAVQYSAVYCCVMLFVFVLVLGVVS